MLRAVIVCGDRELAGELERSLSEVEGVGVARSIDHYPEGVELTRLLRAAAPEVVFISTESLAGMTAFIKQIEAESPAVQIVAIGRSADAEILLETMRAGVREFIAMPFPFQAIQSAIHRVEDALNKRPVDFESSHRVYSFLPSKAGVGASTIALNVALALSRTPHTPVILSDFDFNSGMLRFMLKLENSHSVADAAERAQDMDESLWPQLVTGIGSLDVLHAGKLNPSFRIEPAQIRHMLEFMRRNYKALCFDLSGNLEKYSLEIMHESKRIFLVCTPEIPSLHLAREKYAFLKTLDLQDRVSVLVNRLTPRPVITPEQIEQILGLPVMMTFPNDYSGVHHALTAGEGINPKSPLGRGFQRLAHSLIDKTPVALDNKKKSFLEFFSVAPGRAS